MKKILLATVFALAAAGAIAQQVSHQATPAQKTERDAAFNEVGVALNNYNRALARVAKGSNDPATSPLYAGCVIPGNASACYFYWTFSRFCALACTNSTGGPNVSNTNGWFTSDEAEAEATTVRNNNTARYKKASCTPETGGGGTFNWYFYTCVIYSTNGGPNPYQ